MAPPTPYKARLKIGSLRQTGKKMMVTKAAGSKVTDEQLKRFLKQEKGVKRMAFGDKGTTVASWRGRHFIKDVKKEIKGSTEYRPSLYGKKTTAEKAFRDTVREEVRQEEAAGPRPATKEELQRQKRLELGKQRVHQYQAAKQIERETGKPLSDKLTPSDSPASAPTSAMKRETQKTSTPSRPIPFAGGVGLRSISGKTPQPTAAVADGTIAAAARGTVSAALPSLFGLRGRVLRMDSQKQEALIHILNTPPELAIFIGRDQTLKIPTDTHCSRDRHAIDCNEIAAGEHVDAKGKIINGEFIAEELYVNNADLPDFVVHLGESEPNIDLPKEPPPDLAIG